MGSLKNVRTVGAASRRDNGCVKGRQDAEFYDTMKDKKVLTGYRSPNTGHHHYFRLHGEDRTFYELIDMKHKKLRFGVFR